MPSILEKRLEDIIAPLVGSLGFELFVVRLIGTQPQVCQVLADRTDGARISLADCTAITRIISPALDVADIIKGRYSLEVSSPGIAKPLVRRPHFESAVGSEIKLEANDTIDGRKRFRGVLSEMNTEAITMIVDGKPYVIPFYAIERANLVAPDILIPPDSDLEDSSPKRVKPVKKKPEAKAPVKTHSKPNTKSKAETETPEEFLINNLSKQT